MRDPHLTTAWRSMADRIDLPFDDFLILVNGWDVHRVDVKGAPVGAIFVNGPEIHACIDCSYRGLWMSKKTLRVLSEVIRKHGYATTAATTPEGAQFVERLGFVFDGQKYVLR